MKSQSVVLITGASSGIGFAIAELLAQEGMTVYGTSRYPDRMKPVVGVEPVQLDVNSADSVRVGVNDVMKRTGPIDVLINNAGYALGGAIEETSLEEAKTQLETNFFGVVRVIKEVLPAMRERAQGRIINMSSAVGWLAPTPFLGYYAASKMALEAFTEALRYEVLPFGVKVSLIEPSFFNTNYAHNRQMAAESIPAYAPWKQRAFNVIDHRLQTAPPPHLVAATVLRAIRQPNPRPRYMVGEGVWGLSFIRRFLPWFAYERGIRRFFNLDASAEPTSTPN
jgi:NAD(P)-dependent dehydrogenase (short-subunit alcohol dehydrogenase family)